MRWFELYPDRLEEEQRAFEELEIAFEIDLVMKERGIIRFQLVIKGDNPNFDLPDKDFDYKLAVVLPDFYPYFRPEVYAYDLSLPRHQHVQNKNLCLLPRPTDWWDPGQTIATLLKEQLPLVLEKGSVSDLEKVKEDVWEQAEPIGDYYPVILHAPVLFDPTSLDLDKWPTSFQQIATIEAGLPSMAEYPSRLAVLSIVQHGIKVELPSELRQLFPNPIKGKLFDAPEPPPVDNANTVLKWLRTGLKLTVISEGNSERKVQAGSYKYLIGVSFPQENTRGELGRGWIFIVLASAALRDKNNKVIDGRSLKDATYLARAAYIHSDSSLDRVPKLEPLRSKTVSVAGLGALGSFVTIELARSGVKKLKILDYDVVDPPTTVRWPLGFSAAGKFKTDALKAFIQTNYPNTEVDMYPMRIGTTRVEGNGQQEFDLIEQNGELEKFLHGSDLMVDATAELGVTNFLFRKAIKKSLPHVIMYATPGAWGGLVMRWRPMKIHGCWYCMRLWQNENQNSEQFVPLVDFNGEIQPPGCGDKTFTGAGFDLQQVSMAGVRLVVSTLCDSQNGGYPELDYDWAVLKLFEKDGRPILPQWTGHRLERHSHCPICN